MAQPDDMEVKAGFPRGRREKGLHTVMRSKEDTYHNFGLFGNRVYERKSCLLERLQAEPVLSERARCQAMQKAKVSKES